MAQKPSLVSSIQVDSPAINIFKGPDGSLTLSDPYVPGIRLRDIIQGSVVVEPSTLVIVETTDWVLDPVSTLYAIDVPTNYALTGTQLAQVDVVIMDITFSKITLDKIQVQSNNVYLRSTSPIEIYVAIKRI